MIMFFSVNCTHSCVFMLLISFTSVWRTPFRFLLRSLMVVNSHRFCLAQNVLLIFKGQLCMTEYCWAPSFSSYHSTVSWKTSAGKSAGSFTEFSFCGEFSLDTFIPSISATKIEILFFGKYLLSYLPMWWSGSFFPRVGVDFARNYSYLTILSDKMNSTRSSVQFSPQTFSLLLIKSQLLHCLRELEKKIKLSMLSVGRRK